jgi:hypothetical protein
MSEREEAYGDVVQELECVIHDLRADGRHHQRTGNRREATRAQGALDIMLALRERIEGMKEPKGEGGQSDA